jgi:hypothetical protein
MEINIMSFLVGVFLGILIKPICKIGNKMCEDCLGKKSNKKEGKR